MDRHLSPAETARRFGTSIKALRLYEEHGLLTPLRTTNGTTGAAWRVYGPDQIARLLQILALKRFGLSLAQIGQLLAAEDTLDSVLALQERAVVEDRERATRALALIRKARAKLASGEALSIDDLATLTQETVLTNKLAPEDRKAVVAPFRQKHLSPEENASMDQWQAGNAALVKDFQALVQEAKTLMDAGDDASSAAMDFARRIRAMSGRIKGTAPAFFTGMAPKFTALWSDISTDPAASQKLAPSPEIVAYIKTVIAKLKALEGDASPPS